MATSRLMMFKAFSGCKDNATAETLLSMAEGKILQALYPFDQSKTEIPPRYDGKVIELATILFNKMGAEGETQHIEGDVSRTYTDEETLLSSIIPFCAVISSEEDDDEDS